MKIQVKVSHHPSGRYTLMQRNQGDAGFNDVRDPTSLWGNDDEGRFYKAVAAHLARLHAEGHEVDYADVSW